METRWSDVKVARSARGIETYSVEVFHDGLHKYLLLRSGDPQILAKKLLAQVQQWNAAWEKQWLTECRVRRATESKEGRKLHLESQKEIALERTAEAQHLLERLKNVLITEIDEDPTLDWERLKDRAPFPLELPKRPTDPTEPSPKPPSPGPERSHLRYRVDLTFLDRLVSSRKEIKLAAAENKFDADMSAWRDACAALAAEYTVETEAHQAAIAKLNKEHSRKIARWKEERTDFLDDQAKQHAEVDRRREQYEAKSPEAIVQYCERVISNSDYPACVPREFDLELNVETGVLLLNCRLPAPDDLPRLAEVKYVQATDTLSEKHLPDVKFAQLYDDLLYQITLRTLNELFRSDSVKALSTVVFNGVVTSTDKSTGNETTACILSVQAAREVFLAINLPKVDPKACFRQLKGVGSSKLHSVTPIAPIVELRRDDRRFVPSYAVADQLSEGNNLAAMDWEDFEHLIREIFEKEFAYSGGEVKVTQASRDGGVDAIAFDPDPIRGGKIVIQAKRYAYTVGVSAVRDLYGTVLNEGASKGILVTTSDYGPDAYEFATGKPLSLLSGSNLLHLLGKHGISAHINLQEARKLATERTAERGLKHKA
jgi:restriction system protein